MTKYAYIDDFTLITIPFSEVDEELSEFKLINLLTQEEIALGAWHKQHDRLRYEINLTEPIEFGLEYELLANHNLSYNVNIGQVMRNPSFDDRFYYEGELGVSYQKEASTFKLWAPTATEAELIFYGENGEQKISLKRMDSGVWQQTVEGDLDGTVYMYRVRVDCTWREAVDPYAKAVTVNGKKGVVVNLDDTEPDHFRETKRPVFKQVTDAIIYEVHIRDFSSCGHSGITNKGKYMGMIEKGTEGPSGTLTGLDYLVDLGVTHIQLLPIQDFGSVDETSQFEKYNWGYDTIHFNAIEGSYSLDPSNPKERIKELKEFIQTYHENGLRVIFDVVYNHMYVHQESSLEKLVPGYYFRYNLDGSLANGTGVGNDIASERKMVRKLIVDSVTYLAEEYQVDGFRFDLMGILDINTMQGVRQKLSEIDPSIIVLGEGWDLGTPLARERKATIHNSDQLSDISQFNDQFRDKVKGNIFNQDLKGFSNGNADLKADCKMLVSGSVKDFYLVPGIFSDPYKSVNYVECHDNHTLWDKLAIANAHQSEPSRAAMHRLATAMTILSQGIPFLHAGQEFFRTKSGHENSYCSPDEINKLDWERKALHIDNVEYVKGLIALRKKHDVFRFMTREEVKKRMHILDTPDHCLAYILKKQDGMFVVAYNGANESKPLILPANGDWIVLVENAQASLSPLRTFSGGKIELPPISTTVLFRSK
ncbi:MAG: type I pullulanase [Anaerobacillus sp.]|uniref:type I pullulanase n=1 Tax=Anaerobacillus sp. TaxID=1872506 RepID=UPI003918BE82